jgi:hypothetical protein
MQDQVKTSGRSGRNFRLKAALATFSEQTRQAVDDYLKGPTNGVASSCSGPSAGYRHCLAIK